MAGARPYQGMLSALATVVQLAGDADADTLARAATACREALTAALAGESHFVLQERCGDLHANGHRLRMDLARLPVLAGMVQLFQRQGLAELLFTDAADAADLLQFARLCAEQVDDLASALQQRGVRGIFAGRRSEDGPPLAAAPPLPDDESSLRSLFCQSLLVQTLDPNGPVAGRAAKAILEVIAERLLREPRGLEPLLQLQADPGLLAHSVQVCLMAALLARSLGAADRLAEEVAIAGLLHASADPRAAADRIAAARACRALLQHGLGDLWLRAALTIRLLPEVRGGELAEACAEASWSAVVVRVADEFEHLRAATGGTAGALAGLARQVAEGALPAAAVAALDAALAAQAVA